MKYEKESIVYPEVSVGYTLPQKKWSRVFAFSEKKGRRATRARASS